jgi:hypothetical protein
VIAKRRQLYWPGCVESRPGALSVNDTTPNPNIPNTLFVPAFAPDEPGQSSSASQTCYRDSGATSSCGGAENVYYNNYVEDSRAKFKWRPQAERAEPTRLNFSKSTQQVPQKYGQHS